MGVERPSTLVEHLAGPGGPGTTHLTWSPEEELQVVLEGPATLANISEVCRRHIISLTTYYERKAAVLAGIQQRLKTKPGQAESALQDINARRKTLVAEYALIDKPLQETLEGRRLGKNDVESS